MNAYFIARRVYFRALLNLKTQSSIVKQKRKCKNTTTAIFLSNIWFSFFFLFNSTIMMSSSCFWCLGNKQNTEANHKRKQILWFGLRFSLLVRFCMFETNDHHFNATHLCQRDIVATFSSIHCDMCCRQKFWKAGKWLLVLIPTECMKGKWKATNVLLMAVDWSAWEGTDKNRP